MVGTIPTIGKPVSFIIEGIEKIGSFSTRLSDREGK